MMDSNLPIAIQAIDRLNRYARSSQCRFDTQMKLQIYALKARALTEVEQVGAGMPRAIYVKVDCGRCNGTGWYREAWSRCLKCAGIGKQRLDFIETRIGGTLACLDWPLLHDLVWHTPVFLNQADAVLADDWKPRTDGKELTPEELARDLNIVEARWDTGPGYQHYILPLGEFRGSCTMCGSTFDLIAIHTERGRLSWSCDVCQSCKHQYALLDQEYGSRNLLWARLTIPRLTDESRLWIDRHGGMKRVIQVQVMEYV